MGTALVAYINRDQRRIELDPAVRIGARLDSDGEAVLLHMTAWGHCRDKADVLARQFRDAGWTVLVRAFNELDTLPRTATAAVASLESATVEVDEPASSVDQPETTPARHPRTRQRCRVCGHLTVGRGVRSHTVNRQHDDWEAVRVGTDGTITPAQAQA